MLQILFYKIFMFSSLFYNSIQYLNTNICKQNAVLVNINKKSKYFHRYFHVSAVINQENFVTNIQQHLLSVAPMMEYTDRHQRLLHRLISKQTVLYTEMVTTNALVRTEDTLRFLRCKFETEEPLVLQLGGSDPKQMKEASKKAFTYGYKDININVGCPSPKVAGAGCFGAALMLNPTLVAELALSVSEVTNTPTTIKCRIGVDDHDTYEELCEFIRIVSEKGYVKHFIIHARKAILNANFSPHDNRNIPPLRYDIVYSLINDFPNLYFTLNGGIQSIEQVSSILQRHPQLKGVMVGRAMVNAPFQWIMSDSKIYNAQNPGLNRREIIYNYATHCKSEEIEHGKRVRRTLIKPILNLFYGEPNGKLFRNKIDLMMKDDSIYAADILLKALIYIPNEVLDATAYPYQYSKLSNNNDNNDNNSDNKLSSNSDNKLIEPDAAFSCK